VTVNVSRNFPPLTDLTFLTRDDWGRIGRLTRELVVRRTVAGKDEDDRAFAPYSPGYAEAKEKAGASPQVDLTVSGAMLNAIVVEPDATGVTLAFNA
jgi:hypothetical protein